MPNAAALSGDTAFLAGVSEMGALMRVQDWSASPLGGPETWPQPLKTLIGVMLAAKQPMFLAWGPQRTLLYNDAYAEILAAKHPAALGCDFLEVWHEIRTDLLPIVEEAYAGRPVHMDDIELNMERKGYPEETHFAFSYTPVRDEAGQVRGFFCPCIEITEQVFAQRRSASERERLARMFEQAPGFITILEGPEHVFDFVNGTYRQLFGNRDFVGRTAREVFPDLEGQDFFDLLDKVYVTGERFVARHVPIRLERSPGAPPEERVLDFIYEPLTDEAGQVTGIFCEGHDVTETQRAEAALRESKERLRAILETAHDYAIFTTDAEGRIETWPKGAQEVLGWSAAEALGQSLDMTFTPEDRAKGASEIERITARTAGHSPNVRWHLRKDGSRVFIDGVMRPLTDPDGAVVGFVKVGQDVTERQRAEERLQLATEAAELGIFDIDLTTMTMDWDPRQRELWGVGSDGVITDEIFVSGIRPEDRDVVRDAIARAFEQESSRLYAAEYRVRPHGDAQERWVAAMGRVHFDGDRPVRLVGTTQDITKRKRTEAALRKSEAGLRELNETLEMRVNDALAERKLLADVFENTDAMMSVADPDLHLVALNRAYADEVERLSGRRPQVGDRVIDLYADQPEIVDAALSNWRRAVSGEVFSVVQELGDPNRHRRVYERRFEPLHDREGRLVGAYQYATDVTERLRDQRRAEEAEAARREADALYRAYFESTADALFVIRVEEGGGFVIEQVNPAHEAQLGYPQKEVAGKRIEDVLPPDMAQQVIRAYQQVVETGEIYQYRETFDLPAGRQHWDNALVPVPGDDGRVARIFGSSRNVTQQVQTEEAHRQSQKMEAMGQLTGGVAHDFNNLLTPIIASLDMLLRRGVGSERERRLMDGALQSAERAKVLVQRLLAFARRQPLQPGPVDVRHLVRNMTGLIASTLGPRVDVRVELPEDLPPAMADANQLEMAVLNLAVNARDAMPDAGVLTISAARESVRRPHSAKLRHGHYVRLSVKDTGIGMDEATLARAVEPFFSTKGIGKGTGLGLSMVHGLASQLGGGLTITSSPGDGTTVDLWLPISAVAVEDGLDAHATTALQAQGTALLVDDEDLVRMSTADMLTDLGYEVVEAQSAEEALSLISEGLHPDLLVTDHLMPGMSGVDLARDVRSRWPALPVLIVSGYAEIDGIASLFSRLTKPFRSAELAERLAALMPARGE